MKVIVTQYGINICTCNNMAMLPRIGETMSLDGRYFEVKDVIWHFQNMNIYVEVKI